MRRTLILIAAVIVLIGIGVGVYFYFASRDPGVKVDPNPIRLPGGENVTQPGPGDDGTSNPSLQPDTPIGTGGTPARLHKISAGPVVPSAVVTSVAVEGSTPAATVSYIERKSGNVFTYNAQTGVITRTSNRTMPGIVSARWLPDASVAFVQYLSKSDLSTVNTYALAASSATSFFLPQNISDLSVSSTSVLTLASGINGSVATIQSPDGTESKILFTTPLSSVRLSFAGEKQYLAFTKPSSTLPGNAFLVSPSGHFSRIAGPLDGLVALASPLGKWVLVSYVRGGDMRTNLIDLATGESIPLPIGTIADKCVWSADDTKVYCGVPISPSKASALPDDWYQGAVQFSDRIWKIEVGGRFAQLVLDFTATKNGTLDAIGLAVDPLQKVLTFVNKTDGSLWAYQL